MVTMCTIDEVVRAAAVIASKIAHIEFPELVQHRQTLQIAYDSLGRVLSSSSQGALLTAQPYFRITGPFNSTQERNSLSGNHGRNHESSETMASAPPPQSPIPDDALVQPQKQQNGKVSQVMGTLDRNSNAIHAWTDQEEAKAVLSNRPWTVLDPRHVDIELAKGGHTWTKKFRGWLGRYSFADDYLTWAQKTKNQPRDEFLILTAKDADNRGKGLLGEFLSSVQDKDESTRKAIQYGLKYHSFEHIYGSRGVSAVLFGVCSAFTQVNYPDLPSLAHSIRESSTWSHLAEKKTDWVSQCLLLYNDDCGTFLVRGH